MKNNDFKSFLFRTAVAAMACDGDIADSEVKLLKELVDKEINFIGFEYENMLLNYVQEIKSNGKKSINNFLQDIKDLNFNGTQKLKLVEICLEIIHADGNIESGELNFLHLVILNLNVGLESLIVEFPQYVELILNSDNSNLQSGFTNEILFNN